MNKRDSIKKTALELFAQRGYHATSVSEISKKANVSKGLVYNYFDSKEALLKELFFDGIDDLKVKFLYSYSNGTARDIKLFLKCYLSYIEENKNFLSVFYQMRLNPNYRLDYSNELKFIFSIISNHFGLVDSSLLTRSFIHGITFNFIIGNLTINEIKKMFLLYSDKKKKFN